MFQSKPSNSFVRLCSGVSFSALVAFAGAANAQTTSLTPADNEKFLSETAKSFLSSHSALTSKVAACTQDEKVDKLAKEMDSVKLSMGLFHQRRARIATAISDIQTSVKKLDADIAASKVTSPAAANFKAVSDRLQTANRASIVDADAKDVARSTRAVLEKINAGVKISFTDSKGKRRFANAADVNALDPEQRAVLESVSLAWMNGASLLTGYSHKMDSEKVIDQKDPKRLVKKSAISQTAFSDADAKFLVMSANGMIKKADIMLESQSGDIRFIGKDIQAETTKLARVQIDPLKIQTELLGEVAARFVDLSPEEVASRVAERDSLYKELAWLGKDQSQFDEAIGSATLHMNRLQRDYDKCLAKLAPVAPKPELVASKTVKRDFLAEAAAKADAPAPEHKK